MLASWPTADHSHEITISVVAGGNTGIGYISAKELCTKGYDVTIACRDDGKAAAAKAKIEAAVPGAKIATASLDLADLASVRDAAHRILDAGTQHV